MNLNNISTPLLTIKEVADRLKISRTLLHKLRKSGKITPIIVGDDQVRFTETEVSRFINESVECPN